MATRVYKGLTAQQLRSFWETARLGSVAAAASSLGLTASTVYKQIRALEQEFGEPLVKAERRRYRLTDAGILLARLVGPTVEDFAAIKNRFHAQRKGKPRELVIATTPRIMLDDLPACVAEFRRLYPDVRLILRDFWKAEVHSQVEAGNADLGFVMNRSLDLTTPWIVSRWLDHVPIYQLQIALVVPSDHPLTLRKKIEPADLRPYRIVNARNSFPGLTIMAILESEGMLDVPKQHAEGFFAPSIEKSVAMGLGIGFVETATPNATCDPAIRRIPLPTSFGRPQVYALRLIGKPQSSEAIAFETVVREVLGGTEAGR